MKSIDRYTLDWAAEQVIALDSIGIFECQCNYDNDPSAYLPDDIEYFCGASRMCFKIEGLDGWVIKVDFAKEKGYCKREYEFYKEAVKLGISDCFATTYKIMELDDGRVAILQELVEVDEDKVTSEWYNYASREVEDNEDGDRVWDYVYEMGTSDRLYAVFGDDKRFNIIDQFCRVNNINDLHEGNWGTTENGNLVIMDFAGYGIV